MEQKKKRQKLWLKQFSKKYSARASAEFISASQNLVVILKFIRSYFQLSALAFLPKKVKRAQTNASIWAKLV